MKKLSILAVFAFYALADYNPAKIEKSDLNALLRFENSVYALTAKRENYHDKILQTITFLNKYKTNHHDHSLLTVDLKAQASLRNGYEENYYEENSGAKHRENIALTASYPIFDQKETKERMKKKQDTKNSIVKLVAAYFDLKREYKHLTIKEKYLRLKEQREKVRTKSAVINLDDRLKTIEDLIEISDKIAKTAIAMEEKKQLMVNLVPDKHQKALEKLL